MRKIEMGDLFEPVEIGLWGEEYEVLMATKQVEGKVADALKAIQTAFDGEDEDDDEPATDAERLKIATIVADGVDAVLKPIEGDNGDKPPRAKTHLLKLYKANELGIAHLQATFEQVYEAYQGRNRPTSSSPDQNDG